MVVVVVILVEVNDEEIGSMEIIEEIILQKLEISGDDDIEGEDVCCGGYLLPKLSPKKCTTVFS